MFCFGLAIICSVFTNTSMSFLGVNSMLTFLSVFCFLQISVKSFLKDKLRSCQHVFISLIKLFVERKDAVANNS